MKNKCDQYMIIDVRWGNDSEAQTPLFHIVTLIAGTQEFKAGPYSYDQGPAPCAHWLDWIKVTSSAFFSSSLTKITSLSAVILP